VFHLKVKQISNNDDFIAYETFNTSFRTLRLIRIKADILRKRFMYSCRLVPNLLRYMCAKNYFNVKTLGTVIAKTKGAVFWGHSVHSL